MTTRLAIINHALTILDASLVDTLEESESARVINAAYPPAARRALEQMGWNFATLRQSLGNDTPLAAGETLDTVSQYRHNKPSDWVRTVGVYNDAACLPYHEIFYDEEKGEILSQDRDVWMRYVSSTYIDNTGHWPQSFADYVSYSLASRVRSRFNQSRQKVQEIEELTRRARKDAVAFDAKANSNQRRRQGSYVTARHGGYGRRREDR